MGRRSTCPYCGFTETANKGVRKTKTLGVRVLKRCKACKRKFTPKHQPSVIEGDEVVDSMELASDVEETKDHATTQPRVEPPTSIDRGPPAVDPTL